MISAKAQRWWAWFFAVAGVVMSLAGLLFGVGLLVVPVVGGLLSAVALAQVWRRRPMLSTPSLRNDLFYNGARRRRELFSILLFGSVVLALFSVVGVMQSADVKSPDARAIAWAFTAIAFGTEGIVLAGLSTFAFHTWWAGGGGNMWPGPSGECPACGYALGRARGANACPECGWKAVR